MNSSRRIAQMGPWGRRWCSGLAGVAALLAIAGAPLEARAQTINYTYDEAGRLIEADYGGGNTIAFTNDAAGNLLRREVASGAAFVSVSSASFAPAAPLAVGPRLRARLQDAC